MIKHLFLSVILLLIISQSGIGQVFPKGEAGQITYYEVINVDSLSRDVLYHNAYNYLSSLQGPGYAIEFTLADSINAKISTHNTFSVYTGTGVLRKLSGKFTYDFTVEVKDNRYRYTINNFVYHEYQADRFHNIVATGKTKNLEEEKAVGWQKLWDKHRNTLAEKISSEINALKNKIIEKPKPQEVTPPKNNGVKWDD